MTCVPPLQPLPGLRNKPYRSSMLPRSLTMCPDDVCTNYVPYVASMRSCHPPTPFQAISPELGIIHLPSAASPKYGKALATAARSASSTRGFLRKFVRRSRRLVFCVGLSFLARRGCLSSRRRFTRRLSRGKGWSIRMSLHSPELRKIPCNWFRNGCRMEQ